MTTEEMVELAGLLGLEPDNDEGRAGVATFDYLLEWPGAGMVVEAMQARGWAVATNSSKRGHGCAMAGHGRHSNGQSEHALPEAICRAALKALRGEGVPS